MTEAAQRKARAEAMKVSKSFASRRLRLIQAKKRSTTQRRGWTAKPTLIGAFAHDLDGDHGGRGDLLAGVAAVGKDLLDERKRAA